MDQQQRDTSEQPFLSNSQELLESPYGKLVAETNKINDTGSAKNEEAKKLPRNNISKGNLAKSEAYAMRHLYGEVADNDSDDEEDDPDYPMYRTELDLATPMTKRRLKNEHAINKTGKIGPVKTFFTLIKGFVATGVLFLPKGWRNGGWLFSSLALIMSWIFTWITSLKLLEIRKKYKLSFSEIGFKAYGTPGKVAVDFFLAFTQTIFVWAYVSFIWSTVNNILEYQFKVSRINNWYISCVILLIYVPLTLVRKIEKFAFFHIFADVAIMVGLITIWVYASMELGEHGSKADDTELINTTTFLSFIGLAAYTFEGIGIIIPVMETTSRPDLYPYIVIFVIVSLTGFYMFFGNFTYFIYGKTALETHPLITDILPNDKIPVNLIGAIWIINLIFTYPLVLHPANMVIESYLYKGWRKSPKRMWMKNLTRTLLVIFTIALATALVDTLDKLESINGAFACIPLAFLLPCLFHYKLIAETRNQKIVDLVIAGISFALQIVCTVVTFLFWND